MTAYKKQTFKEKIYICMTQSISFFLQFSFENLLVAVSLCHRLCFQHLS